MFDNSNSYESSAESQNKRIEWKGKFMNFGNEKNFFWCGKIHFLFEITFFIEIYLNFLFYFCIFILLFFFIYT